MIRVLAILALLIDSTQLRMRPQPRQTFEAFAPAGGNVGPVQLQRAPAVGWPITVHFESLLVSGVGIVKGVEASDPSLEVPAPCYLVNSERTELVWPDAVEPKRVAFSSAAWGRAQVVYWTLE